MHARRPVSDSTHPGDRTLRPRPVPHAASVRVWRPQLRALEGVRESKCLATCCAGDQGYQHCWHLSARLERSM